MFDFIRKHGKIVMFLLFLLIIPSFIFVGVLDRYAGSAGAQGEEVASVDGHKITRGEWEAEHQRQSEQIRASNPRVSAAALDSAEARYATLENMIRQRLLVVAATKENLVTPDSRVQKMLMSDPQLQKEGGGFDVERYRMIVASQGMTPAAFENKLRGDLSSRQVLVGVGGTSFAPAGQADVTLGTYFERREIQWAQFNAADFMAKATPSDADVEAYYKAHENDYKAPEEVSIEYVVLTPEAATRSVTVNEADLRSYYQQNIATEAAKEERRTSHILIESPASDPADKRAKAKARAEELLVEVRKAPNSFADLAKKNSQDPGSAPNGGDLDYARRGAFASKSLEEAAFALKNKGDISDVVESEFGYHIVRLTDVRAPKIKSFEEMRPQLEAEYRNQAGTKKFSEMADNFTNMVYEQSDSLKPAADKYQLQIQTASNVMRNPAPGATGPLANPNFLKALFSADALDKQRNTEAIEVGTNQLASGRVTKHTPARTMPFAEVKNQARAALVAQRSAELAKAEGEARLAAWKEKPADAKLNAAVTVSRNEPGNAPAQVLNAALRADPTALPAWVGVDLGALGYAVVKVAKLVPREAPPADQAQQERLQYGQVMASAEAVAYYEYLKQRFGVKVAVPKPAAAVATN